jgi:hypothetical protein
MPRDQSRVVAHGPRAAQRPRKAAMTGRPNPVRLAAEFLRKRLARGPVLVSELEVAARAVGLLGDGQRITGAKPFKTAKKSLGIRSVRSGFGSAGVWLWLLEQQHNPSPDAEPASKAAPRIPSSWIEGVARLDQRRPPPDIPPHRWRQFVSDCNKFLAYPGEWAERAAALGWDTLALFGCCRHRPLDRPRSAGLLWTLNGGRLVELHRDWTVVELAENGSRRVFDRRRLAGNVWLPWIGA